MDRKGISPVISIVLILMVTMTVLGIFSSWAPSLVQNILGDTENQSLHQTKCNKGSVEILSAKHFADGNTTVVVRNTGTIELTDVQVSAWKNDLPAGNIVMSISRGDYSVDNISSGSKPDYIQAMSGNCDNPTDRFEDID